MTFFGIRMFWSESAFRDELQRHVFQQNISADASFDPERIDHEAIRVAIAAYHGVGLQAIREDSYFIRPMREALRAFGRYTVTRAAVLGPAPYVPVNKPVPDKRSNGPVHPNSTGDIVHLP